MKLITESSSWLTEKQTDQETERITSLGYVDKRIQATWILKRTFWSAKQCITSIMWNEGHEVIQNQL